MSEDILFLRQHEVLALHVQLIQVFGGLATLRDEAALEAALVALHNVPITKPRVWPSVPLPMPIT